MNATNVETVGGRRGSMPVRPAPAATDVAVRPLRCNLGRTVSVDYEIALPADGAERRSEVRIEFPDEVRGLLETACGGAGVVETIDQVGAAYLGHLLEAGELNVPAASGTTRALSLEYLRAALAALTAHARAPDRTRL
jgi:hypothetical protein